MKKQILAAAAALFLSANMSMAEQVTVFGSKVARKIKDPIGLISLYDFSSMVYRRDAQNTPIQDSRRSVNLKR